MASGDAGNYPGLERSQSETQNQAERPEPVRRIRRAGEDAINTSSMMRLEYSELLDRIYGYTETQVDRKDQASATLKEAAIMLHRLIESNVPPGMCRDKATNLLSTAIMLAHNGIRIGY